MTPQLNPNSAPRTSAWKLFVASVWILGFLWLFFRQPLDSSQQRWEAFADEILAINPPALRTGEASVGLGVEFLDQRVPLFAKAGVILIMALPHGVIVNRLIVNRFALHWSERIVICLGAGLSLLSLVTLLCGLCGQLTIKTLAGPSAASGFAWLLLWSRKRSSQSGSSTKVAVTSQSAGVTNLLSIIGIGVLLLLIPCAGYLLLGAASPPTDFDVREYHLQGPKEWFQQGRITFLRHNVYTSFPLLSEMLLLAGMVLADDWWQGSLIGQIVLSTFQLLSALSIFSIGRRWICTDVAWLASLFWLTTPWTLRISLIAYAEGALTFFLISSVMLALLATAAESLRDGLWLALLCGMFGGAAMASKYTGAISTIIPAFGILSVFLFSKNRAIALKAAVTSNSIHSKARLMGSIVGCYAVGVLITMSPWLFRNFHDTGNPVYPLAWSVFGGREWSQEMNVRWIAAHSAADHSLREIPRHFLDVAVRNMWTSGLLFALAVPSVLLPRRWIYRIILLLILWQFAAWWMFTHRIDRFWIPAIPLLCLAAASNWNLCESRLWRTFLGAVITCVTCWNIWFCTLAMVGFHAGLMDLEVARELPIRSDIAWLNRNLPSGAKVLMVGEAEVFDAEFPLVYNTVFDDCIFEEWTVNPADRERSPMERRMKSGEAIRAKFQSQGVTHVLVNWEEILRYRLPGSYGYAEFVQPFRFQQLLNEGVLRRSRILIARSWSSLSETELRAVESWSGYRSLIEGDDSFSIVQLFEVASGE